MAKYVVVTGTNSARGSIYLAQKDVIYNLKQAKSKRDKVMYRKMMKLKTHINYGVRMADAYGHPCISLKNETWKDGERRYVIRDLKGKFKAVI